MSKRITRKVSSRVTARKGCKGGASYILKPFEPDDVDDFEINISSETRMQSRFEPK